MIEAEVGTVVRGREIGKTPARKYIRSQCRVCGAEWWITPILTMAGLTGSANPVTGSIFPRRHGRPIDGLIILQ